MSSTPGKGLKVGDAVVIKPGRTPVQHRSIKEGEVISVGDGGFVNVRGYVQNKQANVWATFHEDDLTRWQRPKKT